MLAGLDDLLPVRPDVAEKLIGRYRELKIAHDLIGRWQNELEPSTGPSTAFCRDVSPA